MGAVSRFVKKMPGPVRRLYYAAIPFSIRYGVAYRNMYTFINTSQWYSYQELQSYQLSQLNHLLEHAYENVPYYKRIFNERGLKPKDIQCLSDLSKLPILTRDIIINNFDDLVASNFPKNTLKNFSTSGSTGKPLVFLGADSIYKAEAAFISRSYNAHGTKLYDEKTIWLRRYVPSNNDPIFKYDYELRRLYLSAYHLSHNNIKEYVNLINEYDSCTLVGYPSSLYILALLLEESGLHLEKIRIAHAASEKMLTTWKNKIEAVLGVPVKSHYGMIEKVSMFFQCSCSDFYHESLEYGITEFVNEKNGIGQVVGTGFLNYAMPFIRYQMNDFAKVNVLISMLARKNAHAAEGFHYLFKISKEDQMIL